MALTKTTKLVLVVVAVGIIAGIFIALDAEGILKFPSLG